MPILVAINKIDSPKADIERTEQMLMQAGIQIEKLGGEIQAIPVSALKKQNLGQLTEALVLQADLLEIGADPKGLVEAVVIESKLDPHRGKLCTVVVQRGEQKFSALWDISLDVKIVTSQTWPKLLDIKNGNIHLQ